MTSGPTPDEVLAIASSLQLVVPEHLVYPVSRQLHMIQRSLASVPDALLADIEPDYSDPGAGD